MAKLPCPPELWPAFSTLLDEALELPEEERPKWLAALGAEQDAVRPWLARVLLGNTDTREDQFLRRPVLRDPQESEFREGQAIGPYVLEHKLGSGGMGEVWLASRTDGQLNRQVALKLPYSYLLADIQRRRFERERDILATLSHPNIAQLYDAGVADNQHPYLAMERVDGVPITQYCKDHKLALTGRLDLFRQVLEAVGYAHARLIAHRDLKPSNILVTADGRIKLLDFGIAKLLGGDSSGDATELTRLGGRAATPDYAAPEQLAGDPTTVAVDLYALGVVLHELLVGERPFRNPRKSAGTIIDFPRASARVTPARAADVGGMEARQLKRALSGDLDAIIAKALEADPANRYRSAEAFANDIDASLGHRAISARRIGPGTVLLKFVQRHRLAVGMAAAFVAVLIGGSIAVEYQALRAQREAQRATAIKDFLIGMFRASDPSIASDKPRGTITARELLDKNSARIETEFANDPETEIDLLGVTSKIYGELGESDRLASLHTRYMTLASARYGRLNPLVIRGLLEEADWANSQDDSTRAAAILSDVDIRLNEARLNHTELRGTWWLQRSRTLKANFSARAERAKSLDTAISIFEVYAPQSSDLPVALEARGFLSITESDFDGAIAFFQTALSAESRLHERHDGETQTIYEGLGQAQMFKGRYQEADAAYEKAIDLAFKTYGPHHWRYWHETAYYARMLHMRGQRKKANAMLEKLQDYLPSSAEGYSDEFQEGQAVFVQVQRARCLADEGSPEQAVPLFEKAEVYYQKSPSFDSDLLRLRFSMADAYDRSGHLDKAAVLFDKVVSEYEQRSKPQDKELQVVHERWAQFLVQHHRLSEAEPLLHKVIQLSTGNGSSVPARAYADLASSAMARDKTDEALKFSDQALQQLDSTSDLYNIRVTTLLWRIRAQALLASGDLDGAQGFAQRALTGDLQYDDPGSADIAADRELLKQIEARKGGHATSSRTQI